MKTIISITIFLTLSLPLYSHEKEEFFDVPCEHWSKPYLDSIVEKNIIKGYSDNTFKGNNCLTRYEFIVALERMVAYILDSQKPLLPIKDKQSKLLKNNNTHWAKPSIAKLVENGFVTKDYVTDKNGNEYVTKEEVGTIFADVAVKIIELTIPSAFENNHQDTINSNY